MRTGKDRPMTWRLGRRPALDGIRGLAILAVLLAHFDNPYTNPLTGAGAIGVTVFFTLSGFLITALMLDEYARSDRVRFGAFYRRRALRLLPALLVVLAFVVAVEAVGAPTGVSPGMGLAVLFYYSNFWQLAHPGLNGLSQTWSLSIEEHFYLVWPVLFVLGARWGRRGIGLVGAGLLALSVLSMSMTDGRAQEWGSLSRASSIIAGCLLALWMSGRREGRTRPLVAGAAVALLAPLAVMHDGLPIEAYLLGVPALTVVALWAAAQGAGPGWLSARWLRWLGARSYAVYLWHYPLIHTVGVTSPWWVRPAVLVPLSLLIAEVSWRFVERPAQRLGRSGDARDAAQELVGDLSGGRGSEGRAQHSDVGRGDREGQSGRAL